METPCFHILGVPKAFYLQLPTADHFQCEKRSIFHVLFDCMRQDPMQPRITWNSLCHLTNTLNLWSSLPPCGWFTWMYHHRVFMWYENEAASYLHGIPAQPFYSLFSQAQKSCLPLCHSLVDASKVMMRMICTWNFTGKFQDGPSFHDIVYNQGRKELLKAVKQKLAFNYTIIEHSRYREIIPLHISVPGRDCTD